MNIKETLTVEFKKTMTNETGVMSNNIYILIQSLSLTPSFCTRPMLHFSLRHASPWLCSHRVLLCFFSDASGHRTNFSFSLKEQGKEKWCLIIFDVNSVDSHNTTQPQTLTLKNEAERDDVYVMFDPYNVKMSSRIWTPVGLQLMCVHS